MRPSPATPPLARLLALLVVAWTAFALVEETAGALAGWDHRAANAPACGWRFGMAPVERFQRCLAGVEGVVPRDSVVVFLSAPGTCSAQFFRWRWASYLLPDLLLTTPEYQEGRQLATWELVYHTDPEPPPGTTLELVRQLDGGRLYRVRR